MFGQTRSPCCLNVYYNTGNSWVSYKKHIIWLVDVQVLLPVVTRCHQTNSKYVITWPIWNSCHKLSQISSLFKQKVWTENICKMMPSKFDILTQPHSSLSADTQQDIWSSLSCAMDISCWCTIAMILLTYRWIAACYCTTWLAKAWAQL